MGRLWGLPGAASLGPLAPQASARPELMAGLLRALFGCCCAVIVQNKDRVLEPAAMYKTIAVAHKDHRAFEVVRKAPVIE